jgi:hypothetical protein
MDPSGFLYAFRPSNNPYESNSQHHFTATIEYLCLQKALFPYLTTNQNFSSKKFLYHLLTCP